MMTPVIVMVPSFGRSVKKQPRFSLSLVVPARPLAFSSGGLCTWWNTPGDWVLAITTVVSVLVALARCP
jgi:hypothetical protein